MSDFQPGTERLTPRIPLEMLRWLGMVPAALFGGWLGRSLGGLLVFLRNPGYPEFLFPLLFLLPSGLAFTVAGALVAPRFRIALAIGLAALCMIQAIGIHILTQSNPGVVNDLHAVGESLGATLGALLITLHVRKSRKGEPRQYTQ